MNIDENKGLIEISKKSKVIIMFIDYIFIIALISILNSSSILSFLEIDTPWLFRLLIYFLYYTLTEFYFNRTLGMKLFGVSIKFSKQIRLNKSFLIYSTLVLFDRVLLLVFYIFQVLLQSDKKLLISEKYSGFRWVK
jgi:hypothetical protein